MTKVTGDTNKFQPDEFKKKEKMDNPDEFSKVMKQKVEAQDETQKEGKKPQAAAAEEEEEEAADEAQENPSAGAFSSFMEEQDTSLTPETQQQNAPVYQEEPENMVSQEEFDNINTSTLDENAEELNRPTFSNEEQQPATQQAPQQQTQQNQQAQPNQPSSTEVFGEKQAQGPHDKVKKEHTLKSTDPSDQTKKTAGTRGKDEGKKPGFTTKKTESEKQIADTPQKGEDGAKSDDIKADVPQESMQDAGATLADPLAKAAHGTEKDDATKGHEKKLSVDETAMKKETTDKESLKQGAKTAENETPGKHDEEAKAAEAFGMQTGETTAAVEDSLPAAPVGKLSQTASLSHEILKILQKAVLTIRVMKELGMEKTSVELLMPGSPLNGATLELSKYAENTFNLQLLGSPEAVSMFEENREGLEKALKERGLDINMQASRLKEKEKSKTVQRNRSA
jgi:hypothetical protein